MNYNFFFVLKFLTFYVMMTGAAIIFFFCFIEIALIMSVFLYLIDWTLFFEGIL